MSEITPPKLTVLNIPAGTFQTGMTGTPSIFIPQGQEGASERNPEASKEPPLPLGIAKEDIRAGQLVYIDRATGLITAFNPKASQFEQAMREIIAGEPKSPNQEGQHPCEQASSHEVDPAAGHPEGGQGKEDRGHDEKNEGKAHAEESLKWADLVALERELDSISVCTRCGQPSRFLIGGVCNLCDIYPTEPDL